MKVIILNLSTNLILCRIYPIKFNYQNNFRDVFWNNKVLNNLKVNIWLTIRLIRYPILFDLSLKLGTIKVIRIQNKY